MRQTTPGLTLAGIATLLLVACGGGGGGSSSSSGGNTPNQAPVANAGLAQSVTSGATVTLNGTASSDPDGTIASYTWTQTAGTPVTLTLGSTSRPTFTAPAVGAAIVITFSLQVRDNRNVASTPSTVNITVNPGANAAPIANAGANQSVSSGATVTLYGTANDSDGSIASYAWTQTAGTAVTLSSGTAWQPTFTAPTVASATTLTFSLVVTDDDGAVSAPSTVNITVNPGANAAPTANAGADQSVSSGATVTLIATGSSDTDGYIASYVWTQTAGTPVTLSSGTASQPTFTAPTVVSATTLTFSLVVTDDDGATSSADTVDITVNPVVAGNVNVTGTVTFGRVLISASSPRGLLYGSPVQQPSRGVLVRAIDANTHTLLATGSTSDTGTYSLSVPSSASVTIEVVARLVSNASPALPRWNIRVQNGDGTAGDAPYTHVDGPFSPGSGTTRNIAIPTGISSTGTGTTRASGPFAILDTVYQGLQTVLGVAPNTNFPDLIVSWGSNANLGTFFSSGSPQYISLLSSLTADTDEFDQHVIAHEFGHYIEFNFSRADNIGGQHTFGEKLDPRVAFGEGFGYAFAGIVLNNTDARDTFTDNGVPRSTGFNIESNPPTNQAGSNEDYGCWCSETSVYSLLWDFYDSAADANDNVALGFAPLWNVLISEQKTTPAFTTIFPFVTALKAALPADAGAIDTLLAAQNINGTDAWGTGETHVPTSVPSIAVLPLYTTITRGGGAVTLRTVNDEGVDNKLGNHRFLRFTPATNTTAAVSLYTTNASNDPDFTMKQSGAYVLFEDDPPPGPETGTAPVTGNFNYVLDVYDCDNGCPGSEEVGGDYDLTVQIN